MEENKTLRFLLSKKKPFVQCKKKAKGNTRNEKWPNIISTDILDWESFNMDVLNGRYGHILDLTVPEEIATTLPSTEELEGVSMDQDDSPKILIAWADKLIQPLVHFAKSRMGINPGHTLRHTCFAVGESSKSTLPDSSRANVDHIIQLDDGYRRTLLVGLGRISSKWHASHLAGGNLENTHEDLWPIRQLANLCKRTGTRYGYIQTDEALAACCFSKSHGGTWQASVKLVPWNTDTPDASGGCGVLTTQFALWFLCMLALGNPDRRIVDQAEVVSSAAAGPSDASYDFGPDLDESILAPLMTGMGDGELDLGRF